MGKFIRNTNVDSAKVIKVLEVKSIVGDGVHGDPVRQITEYFTLDGVRLARKTSESEPQLGVWVDEESNRNS